MILRNENQTQVIFMKQDTMLISTVKKDKENDMNALCYTNYYGKVNCEDELDSDTVKTIQHRLKTDYCVIFAFETIDKLDDHIEKLKQLKEKMKT